MTAAPARRRPRRLPDICMLILRFESDTCRDQRHAAHADGDSAHTKLEALVARSDELDTPCDTPGGSNHLAEKAGSDVVDGAADLVGEQVRALLDQPDGLPDVVVDV